jgi:GNAT superfamily N-acetyltransferase
VLVRDFTFGDYKAIAALINELGYPTSEEEARERLERINSEKTLRTMVTEFNGRVVGFIGLSKSYAYEKGCYVRITALVVSEPFKKKGIGTELILAAEAWAKKQKALSIVLSSGTSRKEAHKFYENKGYCINGYSFHKKL